MKKHLISRRFVIGTVLLIFGLSSIALAQGNSKGKGNSNGKGNRGTTVTGQIPNIDPDENSNHGQGKSKKNNDTGGIFNDNQKGNGSNNRFKGLSKKTGISPGALQTRYEIERRLNPDLTYGQFVAAHMVAKNHRGVSTGDILAGLRNNRSIGQVLQNKGWDKGKIDKERKRIKKDRDHEKDGDYDDNDRDWRLPF